MRLQGCDIRHRWKQAESCPQICSDAEWLVLTKPWNIFRLSNQAKEIKLCSRGQQGRRGCGNYFQEKFKNSNKLRKSIKFKHSFLQSKTSLSAVTKRKTQELKPVRRRRRCTKMRNFRVLGSGLCWCLLWYYAKEKHTDPLSSSAPSTTDAEEESVFNQANLKMLFNKFESAQFDATELEQTWQ